ncbi:MAG TPA: bifunctional ADP-dependent NAD(P)H-hydrate dehydratase/NAD(P)H-hydrate epimerase [Syntrophobacteraceae bacterium]|nr:bifunctional ADP-dependent NAD(P)H-hydrate dehydratase/NAD(P)H-hydrate epimerase [Syntrophobacteraceae bacterium]
MFIVTAQEMAELDRQTIEEIGIPGIVLMENAGRGAAAFFEEVLPDLLNRRITILAGSGNNAGDGFVLARLFWLKDADVRVICLRPPDRLKGDALTNFRIMEKLGVPVYSWDEQVDFDQQWAWIEQSDVIIDAILGTGLESEVRGFYRTVIEAVNALSVPILAVDVPSGLDASSGSIMGTAIHALATATFGLPKVGQVISPGEDHVGRLGVVDIGIPPQLVETNGVQRWWLDEELASTWLQPRDSNTHKGHAGHVAAWAGSPGKTGAAAMLCQGAGRVGAGLVTLFVPASLNPILEIKLTEAMTLPLTETSNQCLGSTALPEILRALEGKQSFAMGPGISVHPEALALVRELVNQCPCPLVLDADALTAMADDIDRFATAQAPVVLTPHPGEMARLLKDTPQAIQERRLEVAAEFSQLANVTVVLKGHRTVIASPDGRLAINSSGNPAMASGGMGDVLTGMIAGFLAQGYEPFQAACLGVFVHGLAADRCLGDVASRGLLASDLLNEIPRVIGTLEGFGREP